MTVPPLSSPAASLILSSRCSMRTPSGRSTTPDSVYSESTTAAVTPAAKNRHAGLPSVQDTPHVCRRKQHKERVRPTHQPGVTVYPLTFSDHRDVYTYSKDPSVVTQMLDREAARIRGLPLPLFDDINRRAARPDEAAQQRITYLTHNWKNYLETGEFKFQFAGFVDDGIDFFARELKEATKRYMDHLKRTTSTGKRHRGQQPAMGQAGSRNGAQATRLFTRAEHDMYWTIIRWKGSLPLHMEEYDVWRAEWETVNVEERRGRTAWGNRKSTTTQQRQGITPSVTASNHRMKRKRPLARALTLDPVVSVPQTNEQQNLTPTKATIILPPVSAERGRENGNPRQLARYISAPVSRVGGMKTVAHIEDDNDDDSRRIKKQKRGEGTLMPIATLPGEHYIDVERDVSGEVSTYFTGPKGGVVSTGFTMQQDEFGEALPASPATVVVQPLYSPTPRRASRRSAKRFSAVAGDDDAGDTSGRTGSRRLTFAASKSSLTSSCSSNASVDTGTGQGKLKGVGEGKRTGRGSGVGDEALPLPLLPPITSVDTTSSTIKNRTQVKDSVTPPYGVDTAATTVFDEEYWAERAKKRRADIEKRKSADTARAAAGDASDDENLTCGGFEKRIALDGLEGNGRAALLDMENDYGNRVEARKASPRFFEFAPPSFPNNLRTSTPKMPTLQRLSQTDNDDDDDTAEVPRLSSSAGRPIWESESFPAEQQRYGKTLSAVTVAGAEEIDVARRDARSKTATTVVSHRTVSGSDLTGLMNDLAGGGGNAASRASPFGTRNRIVDVLDDDDDDDEEEEEDDGKNAERNRGRPRWNVASSPVPDDMPSSGLRATQRIQRMGNGVMAEVSDLLGQALVD